MIDPHPRTILIANCLLHDNITQFPLWDFFECNTPTSKPRLRRKTIQLLSIPFLGFRWMQLYLFEHTLKPEKFEASQFPLWDFVECNFSSVKLRRDWRKFSQFPFWDFVECNLRSLRPRKRSRHHFSQFPFWDFVECNFPSPFRMLCYLGSLSIPFLGFRWMQHGFTRVCNPNCGLQWLSIPFLGFRWMQR